MACVVVVNVYVLSIARAISLERFFLFAVLGTILTLNCVASALDLTGPNTSGGNRFDHVYLQNILAACLIGISIGLVVNTCIFPESAEHYLDERLTLLFEKLSDFSNACNACLVTADFSKEAYDANCKLRDGLVADIQISFRLIDATINQASMEITYSRMSVQEYADVTTQSKSVAAILFSMSAVLDSPETMMLLESRVYQQNMSDQIKVAWREVDTANTKIFRGLVLDSKWATHKKEKESLNEVDALQKSTASALSIFDAHRQKLFSGIFEEGGDDLKGSLASKAAWEKFIQLNYYILATREYAKELAVLHDQCHSCAQVKRGPRFHFNWYVPSKDVFGGIKRRYAKFCAKLAAKETRIEVVQAVLVDVEAFIISPRSIYAIKSAIAVLCLLLIMFLNPHFYKSWHVSYAVPPVAIAVSPSLGQAFTDGPRRMFGVTMGSVFAYLTVLWFGRGSYFHILMAFLASIPCFFVTTFYPAFYPLAFLSLINFGKYTIFTYASLHNPLFDPPAVYLYKVIIITVLALLFTNLFTLIIYPSFARRIVRQRLSDILNNLCIFYLEILKSTKYPINRVEIKSLGNKILSQLVALEPLMLWAAREPRLEGRFKSEPYQDIIKCMYRLLNRFESMRLCVGDSPFDEGIRRVIKFSKYGDARRELHQTIRVLIFMFKSTMLTKMNILPNLPNASWARDSMISSLVSMLVEHAGVRDAGDGEEDPLEGVMPRDREGMMRELSSDKWVGLLGLNVASREVSRVLDRIGDHMKVIFGEAVDIVDPDAEDDIQVEISTTKS
ncbi:hypothetical protein HDU98_010263 [Podochytrium sp. JEL0797]|nr:hypothetical protein HDU98_010245 [Podochytrium sp. JEL0797]KAJ3076987.1 hypothetical protein HDU98_010263 [Podochytrium sp. JEL0797]